ncbi:hypothetical protein E3N88_33589 [Mikania micrantha]|uniref:Uncharacterized protein n=1 Tax=Mikania micrantha TaxID=192012 RepID=A0A5N6ME93_9ASTR|nr:hypothetical protein E3N88_33589 [Mikania micrantha]
MSGKDVTPALGIDLGIRRSCMAVCRHQDKVEIFINERGYKTTTSYVAFTPTEYKVIKGTYGLPKVVIEYKGKQKEYSAEEISSMHLVHLKSLAESHIGTTVKDVVITVPPYFNDSQRQATKVAAHLAGLDVLQIIDKPIAAAIAYGLHMKTTETNVLIFDLDDVAFNVSIVTADEKGKLTVKATGGDTHFGGQEIVDIMVDHIVKEFNKKHQMVMDITGNSRTLRRLKDSIQWAMQDLISNTETTISIDSLYNAIDFSTSITRVKFEDITNSFFSKCIETLASFLRDAKIYNTNVDHIVLVGVFTRIPKVQQLLREFFNVNELLKSINVIEVVAHGAAIHAANLIHKKREKAKTLPIVSLLQTATLSIGVDAHDGGERSRAKDNKWLEEFEVAVSPAPKGKSKVTVAFSIDADGTLNCKVKELTTGLKKEFIINHNKEKISHEVIKKMVKDAEKYKMEDQEYIKLMHARNVLKEYIYNVQRRMKMIGSIDKTRLHAKEIKKMETAIEAANEYIDKNQELADVDEYKKVQDQLEKLCVDAKTVRKTELRIVRNRETKKIFKVLNFWTRRGTRRIFEDPSRSDPAKVLIQRNVCTVLGGCPWGSEDQHTMMFD